MQEFSGMDWIRIDIANQMGLDKELWDQRIQWVHDHESQLENQSLIEQADKPYLYQKAVRAYRKAKKRQRTGFIMSLDATCSGGQVMAVLVGCEATAIQTNLIFNGKRNDLYTNQVTEMNSGLPKANQILLKADPTHANSFTRKEVKDAMIPLFYGSKSSVKKTFGKDSPETQAFHDAVSELIPGVTYCLERIKKVWNPEALVHQWTLPDGHVAHCRVYEPEDRMITPTNLDGFQFVQRAYLNQPSDNSLSLPANVNYCVTH